MKNIKIVVLAVCCMLATGLYGRPQVGAFYYPWFGDYPAHWDGTHGQPSVGYYNSTNDAVIDQHMSWAASCGISYFVISYWASSEFDDIAVGKVIAAAANYGIKFVILIEPFNMPSDTASAAQWYINRVDGVAAHGWFQAANCLRDPSGKSMVGLYQTAGRPEILAQAYSLRPDVRDSHWTWLFGPQDMNLVSLRQVFRSNNGVGSQTYGAYICYQPITGAGWDTTKNVYYAWTHDLYMSGGSRTPIFSPAMPQAILTVSPCFDNTGIGGSVYIPRDGGYRFNRQLIDISNFGHYTGRGTTEANDVQPAYVIVTSWNEWQENSTIEPSVAEGTVYLDLIRQWNY